MGSFALVGCGMSGKGPADSGGMGDVEAYYVLPSGAVRRLGGLDLRDPGALSAFFSADGNTLVTAGNTEFRVWDLATRKLVRRYLAAQGCGWPIRTTSDGRYFVMPDFTTSPAKALRVVSQADGKMVRCITPGGSDIRCFALSPDGKTVAVGTWQGEVLLWDVEAGKQLPFLAAHPPPPAAPMRDSLPPPPHAPVIDSVAFAPDGSAVASAAYGDVVRAWDVITGREIWHFDRATTCAGPFAFSPDGRMIAVPTLRADGATGKALPAGLKIYRVRDRTAAVELDGGGFAGASNGAYCMAFSPDGRTFAAGGADYRLRVWDAVTGKLRFTGATASSVWDLSFSPDSKTLVCLSAGVSLWDVKTGRQLPAASGHTGSISGLALSDDGRFLVTGGQDGTVRAWETATGEQRWRTPAAENGGWPTSVALSPDGKTVAASGFDGIVRVLEAATGRELRRTARVGSMATCAAYSPDGNTLAAGGDNFTVHLWDAVSGEEKGKFVGYDGYAIGGGFAFQFSPDGKTLAAPIRREPGWDAAKRPNDGGKEYRGSGFGAALGPAGEADGKTRLALWDMASGKRLRVFGPPTEFGPMDLAFSPDGGVLAFTEKEIHLIDLRTGEERKRLPAPCGRLAFTKDGRLFIGPGCYAAATGAKLSEVAAAPACLTAVSGTGDILVTADGDGTVVVWDLAGGKSK